LTSLGQKCAVSAAATSSHTAASPMPPAYTSPVRATVGLGRLDHPQHLGQLAGIGQIFA
jgi:hypothetical protein